MQHALAAHRSPSARSRLSPTERCQSSDGTRVGRVLAPWSTCTWSAFCNPFLRYVGVKTPAREADRRDRVARPLSRLY
eukprot:5811783-Prymnesium_polylepis.1